MSRTTLPEQVPGGTPPEIPAGPSPQSPEIIFCIPNVEACNKTDVLINETGGLICDPKLQDCSSYLQSPATTGVQASDNDSNYILQSLCEYL